MNNLSTPSTLSIQMEMLTKSAQSIMRLQQELEEVNAYIDSVVENTKYASVWQFVKNEGIKKNIKEIVAFDLQCHDLCVYLGISMGKIPDERFGSVHSYPVEVLREVLNGTK